MVKYVTTKDYGTSSFILTCRANPCLCAATVPWAAAPAPRATVTAQSGSSAHSAARLSTMECRASFLEWRAWRGGFGGLALKGLSHEIEMNYKWYEATEPSSKMNL